MSGILISFAHPDDETVLTGGLIAKSAAAGIPVALAVATRGEAGKAGDPPVCTVDELPAVREAELRQAAAVLGLADLTWLGYRDRELAAAPVDAIRRQLVRLLRSRRPEIVVTFDPNGSNLHPDHVAISALHERRDCRGGGRPVASRRKESRTASAACCGRRRSGPGT